MLSSDLCTRIRPLYSMKPSLRKRFMKKLTRERVVPIMSARVSWVISGMSILGSHAAGQEEGYEQVREGMLLVHDADHLLPLDLERGAGGDGGGRGHMQPSYGGDRFLSYEVAGGEKGDGGFFASFGDDGEFGTALLQVEDGVSSVSLREEGALRLQLDDLSPQSCVRKE